MQNNIHFNIIYIIDQTTACIKADPCIGKTIALIENHHDQVPYQSDVGRLLDNTFQQTCLSLSLSPCLVKRMCSIGVISFSC